MYFRKAKVIIYGQFFYSGNEKHFISEKISPREVEIQPGTMLINRQRYFLGYDGTHRLTIAHEIIHWFLHQKYFRLLALLDDETDMMSCEVEPNHYTEDMSSAQKAHWFAEWQANALSIRIAMPKALMTRAFQEAQKAAHFYFTTGELVEDVLKRIANLFDVPIFVAKQRARQLGVDIADGAFIHIDGEYHESFSFTKGVLDQHQTFVIDRAGYEQLYGSNADFAALIDSGKFIYIGYVTCINDPQYITARIYGERVEFTLSEYAREHADECCLVYSWHSRSYLKDQFEFYGQAYLSKEVNADYYIEHTYDKDFNIKCVQKSEQIAEAVAVYNNALDQEKKIRKEMASKGCDSFADSLNYHMKRKKIKVEELSERSGLSDTTIKKYRAGKTQYPPIENVMAVCIGLNLHKPYCIHLLRTANYQLTNDSPLNRAYRFLLDYTDGTLEQWNLILDEFHLPHIPDQKNQKTEK